MHEKVKAFLEEKGVTDEDRREKLIRWGLWEKEYAPEGADLIQYPCKDEDGRHWRKEAIEVTNEEWTLIQAAAEKKKGNVCCIALQVVGILCAIMAVLALFEVSLSSVVLWAMYSAFSFGFAQILKKHS
ncbi:MAG: hypothetical protein IJZ66_09340 [Oscillibacter sp.]|nr:hypothetical protein [Oscillibacter sp.]MBQ8852620.1 hypothetical protein [Oscillibacter sp.]